MGFTGTYDDTTLTSKKAEGRGVTIGMDLGARLTIGIVYIEYTFSPVFNRGPLLLSQMNKFSIGLILQFEMDPITYAILSIFRATPRPPRTTIIIRD